MDFVTLLKVEKLVTYVLFPIPYGYTKSKLFIRW